MKKIIITTLIFSISMLANTLFAQQVSRIQRQAIQSDNIEKFTAVFPKADFDKCLNVKDQSYTMLSYSILNNKKAISNFLLNNKADVNKACNGITPLMNAAMHGNADMAKMLLKKGASKSAKNSNGETAKDIAKKNNHPELAKIL
ncbi:ankyrin repeat domain-containing protein [Chryseobacterium sp. C-71]|uniref:ankyrin repeat domain-containing protein n=1 Tax=Chryseobacterium sp. C-71 TaxID=2893882 RepID=UPI001E2D5E18|nr:ankyrin repeat domain-containing protein [Chryseobacterium sp. C-71]UFH33753.1 ankyrin repeat domain-containing protein [Chryseobacterium sp. C-71]